MVILQCPRPAAFKCVFIQDRVDVGKKYNLIDHTEFLMCIFIHVNYMSAYFIMQLFRKQPM